MGKSSLADMLNHDGQVLFSRLASFGNVFDVLGTKSELYGRVAQIGNSPVGQGGTVEIPDDYTTKTLNVDIQVNGNWVVDEKLKLMVVRLTAFGGAPYIDNEKRLSVAIDKEFQSINAQTMDGFIYPNKFDSDFVSHISSSRTNHDLKGGICVSDSTGEEWFRKFMPSMNGAESLYGKLVRAGLLNAELVFMAKPGNMRFVFKVVQGPQFGQNDKFRCGITAISTMDSMLREHGICISTDGKNIVYSSDSFDEPVKYSYDFKTGKIGNLNLNTVAKLCDSNKEGGYYSYSYKQEQAYVRFFVLPEKKLEAEQVLGQSLPEELTKTNGITVTYNSPTQIGNLTSWSGRKLEELKQLYANKNPSISGKIGTYPVARRTEPIEYGEVTIPWPCYVRPSNSGINDTLVTSYQGVKAFYNGASGVAKKVKNRELTEEEINSYINEYKTHGPVKIKMHKDVAEYVQAAFNDIFNYYGSDIIVAVPSATCITSVKRDNGSIKSSAHNTGRAIDFDYDGEPNSNKNDNREVPEGSISDFWNRKNDTTKAFLAIMEAHGSLWGGKTKTFNAGAPDYMHFQWA